MPYSVKTVKPPEILNLQKTDINPFVAKCEIKVMYTGENRNRTSISKAVASEMAKSLRGAMIVGYFKQEKDDFTDHGQVITIDDDGCHFSVKTTPYGFVPTDAEIWFQTFQEIDDQGNQIEREYLMTNGFLWTKAFPEAEKVITEGRPQSMELDNESVQGTWVNSVNNNYEILIINDAIFSKLCILGADVEPCFEGASVSGTEVSTKFSLDDSFKNSVYTMMNEFKEILQGGKEQMENKKELNSVLSDAGSPTGASAVQYEKEKDPEKENGVAAEEKEQPKDEENKQSASEEQDKKKKEDKYSLENSVSIDEYNALKDKYSALEQTVSQLNAFKTEVEREKKNGLINQFTMLSDEDKADVLNNIDKYTLDEIESKLSVICFRKKVNFSEPSSAEGKAETVAKDEAESPITTYTLGGVTSGSTPEWIKAVEEVAKQYC